MQKIKLCADCDSRPRLEANIHVISTKTINLNIKKRKTLSAAGLSSKISKNGRRNRRKEMAGEFARTRAEVTRSHSGRADDALGYKTRREKKTGIRTGYRGARIHRVHDPPIGRKRKEWIILSREAGVDTQRTPGTKDGDTRSVFARALFLTRGEDECQENKKKNIPLSI